jgi:hypothetical protein
MSTTNCLYTYNFSLVSFNKPANGYREACSFTVCRSNIVQNARYCIVAGWLKYRNLIIVKTQKYDSHPLQGKITIKNGDAHSTEMLLSLALSSRSVSRLYTRTCNMRASKDEVSDDETPAEESVTREPAT